MDLHIFGLIHFFIESIVYELQEFSRPWVYDLKWLKTCWFNDVAQKRFGLSHALHTATSLSCRVITMTDFYTMGLRGLFVFRIADPDNRVPWQCPNASVQNYLGAAGSTRTEMLYFPHSWRKAAEGSGMVNFICYYLTSICLHLHQNNWSNIESLSYLIEVVL